LRGPQPAILGKISGRQLVSNCLLCYIPLMNIEQDNIIIKKRPSTYGHIASTDVIVKGRGVLYISTVNRTLTAAQLYQTLIFTPEGLAKGKPVEEPEISKFNTTKLSEKEAMKHHRRAVAASVRFLRALS
jgi:hypothetical protein